MAQVKACEPTDLKLAYPPLARAARVDGSVVLVMRIGANGKPTSTSSSGHPLLTTVSETMVQSSRFPTDCNGKEVTIHIEYRLRSASSPYEEDATTLAGPDSYVVTGNPLVISDPPADVRPRRQNWLARLFHSVF
jgi:hypothetical protein